MHSRLHCVRTLLEDCLDAAKSPWFDYSKWQCVLKIVELPRVQREAADATEDEIDYVYKLVEDVRQVIEDAKQIAKGKNAAAKEQEAEGQRRFDAAREHEAQKKQKQAERDAKWHARQAERQARREQREAMEWIETHPLLVESEAVA